MTDSNAAPQPSADKGKPAPKLMDGQVALSIAGAIAISLIVGHQWGLHDRSELTADVAAAVASPSPSSTSSPSSEPSASTSDAAAKPAAACKEATKYVEGVVRRSDLAAEHPEPTDDGVTACRWVSPTYPTITVSVVAGEGLDDVVAELDDRWTDGAPMENPRMYQYAAGAVVGFWRDPDNRKMTAAAVFDGMNAGSFPTDEGMAATSLAAKVAQAIS